MTSARCHHGIHFEERQDTLQKHTHMSWQRSPADWLAAFTLQQTLKRTFMILSDLFASLSGYSSKRSYLSSVLSFSLFLVPASCSPLYIFSRSSFLLFVCPSFYLIFCYWVILEKSSLTHPGIWHLERSLIGAFLLVSSPTKIDSFYYLLLVLVFLQFFWLLFSFV